MADVFRIEIPVEVTNNTDMGDLQRLETVLGKIHSSLQRNSAAARGTFNAVSEGAEKAGDSLEQVADASEKAEQATDQLSDSAEDASESYEEVGQTAQQAGNETGNAFNRASTNVDRFTQRIERSNQSIRKMFMQKLQLTLAAIDKVSPIVRSVTTSVKNLTAKAWRVTVKMYDMVTAPFRQLKSMIMNPIMVTLSLTGIGMGAGSFVSTFTDFVSGMSNVKALSGATAEEFTLLTEKAEELGATTKFTASEAAEGMQYLAMAGWKTNDIIAAMPGLLDLAAAGGTSLGTAADIVSDVMTAMGMAADEAGRAADIFARTATGTNTTIENLGETLKYAAPIAHSFGLELSEVSTITGMMANAGIKGSQAGTAIRSSLLEMASPAKAAQDVMKKLNLTFSDTNGKMNDLGTIVGDLSEAFSGLSEQEKLAYADDLFGTYASSAWLGVIEQGADEYERLYKSIDQSNGAAHEMAETQLDNLAGDVTKLQSAVDGMKISVMKELDPYLRKGVQWLTGKVPALTSMLTNFITQGIEKGKELKTFLQGVFNSSDFQNAEGFAAKFFVAWDKIIAEPFDEWWNGNGQKTVLSAVEKVGSGLGEMYHGIITGIFAAIKGEEIDFDGLNLTGLAKAGAQAAKSFIDAFKDSLDLGGLFNDAPDLLKVGLFGFGAAKLGGGALGLVKTISQVKLAFNGVSVAAGTATAATNTVAASTVTAAAGAGKLATILTTVKTGLAAIPVWGWVAAAALTAVTIGIIAYSNAQKEHERELLNTGKAAAQMAQDYSNSVERIAEATDSIKTIKKITLQIEEDTGGNQAVIDEFNQEMSGIEGKTVYLTAVLVRDKATPEMIKAYQSELEYLHGFEAIVKGILDKGKATPEDITAYQAELDKLHGRIAYLKGEIDKGDADAATIAAYQAELDALENVERTVGAVPAEGRLEQQQINEYQAVLDTLKGRDVTVTGALDKGTLTDEAVASLQSQINSLAGKTVDVIASLNDEGYDQAQVAIISGQVAAIQEGEKKVTVTIASNTSIEPSKIQEYVTRLTELMGLKSTYELMIEGKGLTPDEIAARKTELEGIKSKLAIVTTKINKGQGTMSDAEWQTLLTEAATLQSQAANIEIALQGASMNDTEIKTVKQKLGEVRGEAAGILLSIGYSKDSDISQDELNSIIDELANIGTIKAELEIGLKEGSMGVDELKALNAQLNESYANLIEASGGYFTQDDVDRGRITQERYDSWVQRETVKAEGERLNFQAQVIEDRGNIDELVQKRDAAQATADYHAAMATGSTADYDFLSDIEAERQRLLGQYRAGQINEDTLMEGGSALIEQARNHQWSDMFGAPANFESMQPDELFGKYVHEGWDVLGAFTSHWEADASVNPFASALKELEGQVSRQDTNNDTSAAEAAAANAALMQHYQNEVRAVELESFAGFGVTDRNSKATIDDLAQSYTQLDTAGQEMFANAIAGLAALNDTVGYLSEAEKVDIGAILGEASQSVTISANVEVMGDLQSKLIEVSKAYQTAESDAAKADFNTANIEAVNAALEALGLEKIENLSQLQSQLDAIAAVDPSGLDFTAAAASLEALGGDATKAQEKVAAAKAQLDALAGTYNVTIKYNVVGSIPNPPAQNATGGIYDGAFLSWVAEDGPEAIIPLGADKRGRGLDLWMQAGEMLGVNEFADGGIMAPFTGILADIPDDLWNSDDDNPLQPQPIPTGGGQGGNTTLHVTVDANPTYQIDGSTNPEDVLEQIRAHQYEIAEIVGVAVADHLEDILSNVV